jgi:hypothetical protein
MKHIKGYKIFENSQEFNIDFVMAKIKENFSEEKVADMFDNEMMNWIDSDWESEYETEYDWYMSHNNGEAQDVVIEEIIDWTKLTYKMELKGDQYSLLFDSIKQNYDTLNY